MTALCGGTAAFAVLRRLTGVELSNQTRISHLQMGNVLPMWVPGSATNTAA